MSAEEMSNDPLRDALSTIADEGVQALKIAVKLAAGPLGVTISDDLMRDAEANVRARLKPGPGITHAARLVVDDAVKG